MRRTESQAQTRDHLRRAARRLFAQRGIGGATVDRITAAAGYTRGAFYANFPCKNAILAEVLKHHCCEESSFWESLNSESSSNDFTTSDFAARIVQRFENRELRTLDLELRLHAARDPEFASTYHGAMRHARSQMEKALKEILNTTSNADDDAAILSWVVRNVELAPVNLGSRHPGPDLTVAALTHIFQIFSQNTAVTHRSGMNKV